MSCCSENKKPRYNIHKNVSRPEPKNKIIVPEPERAPVRRKKFNYVFDLNQSEDFLHKSRILQRFIETDGGELNFVKVRYKPDILEAIYVQQGELRDMSTGHPRRGGGAGWIIQTPLGGSMFVTEDQFSKLFEIVEEEEGE